MIAEFMQPSISEMLSPNMEQPATSKINPAGKLLSEKPPLVIFDQLNEGRKKN
jgi:hypothetical protein